MSVLATFIVYLHIDLVRPSVSIYRQIVIWFPSFFISPNICNDFFFTTHFGNSSRQRQYLVENMLEKRCVSRLTAAIWLLLFKSSCFYFLATTTGAAQQFLVLAFFRVTDIMRHSVLKITQFSANTNISNVQF